MAIPAKQIATITIDNRISFIPEFTKNYVRGFITDQLKDKSKKRTV